MDIRVRRLGQIDYAESFALMREFVASRLEETLDEIWILEHAPVFTQGQGGRATHVHDIGDIPLVKSDRGGQVTYHGPGQLIAYVLVDLRRAGLGPRELVRRIESAVIASLDLLGVSGKRRAGAPGVYVEEEKIAALGLRIRRGSSYHGLSLNVDVDLEPFSRIDPCGYRGLRVTRLKDLGVAANTERVASILVPELIRSLYPEQNCRILEAQSMFAKELPDDGNSARTALG